MKVQEIKDVLTTRYGYTEESLAGWKKDELMAELNEAENVDLNFEAVEDQKENNDIEDREIPIFGTKKWSEFILGELTEDEKQDGYPKIEGLRRLVETYIGTIQVSKTVQLHSDHNGVVILHEIELENKETGVLESYSRVGESNDSNTQNQFRSYMWACAESRAIGRILRSILRVSTISYEEIAGATDNSPVEISFETITPTQIHFIDVMSKPPRGLDVDVIKFIEGEIGTTKKLTREQGQQIQEKLSGFQKDGVPEELKGYKDGWQSSL